MRGDKRTASGPLITPLSRRLFTDSQASLALRLSRPFEPTPPGRYAAFGVAPLGRLARAIASRRNCRPQPTAAQRGVGHRTSRAEGNKIESKYTQQNVINSAPEQLTSEELTSKRPLPDERHCRYCSSIIPHSATVCSECGRDQRWYLNYFRIDHVSLIIALVMMTIAYQQLQEVRRERVAASQALDRASKAEEKAAKVTENLGAVQGRVERQEENIVLLAERAKQSFAEIQTAQQLSLEAKSRLEEAKGLVNKAETSVDQLQDTVDFNLLLTKARNDDREAFDRIVKLTEEMGPFQKTAFDVAVQIAIEVNPLVSVRVDPEVPWGNYAVDPKIEQMDNLLKIYPSLHPIVRPNFISQIWSQERFSKQKRMDFLYEIIKSDRSLRALDRACTLMNKEAKINKNILGAKEYLEWWQTNRPKYDDAK
jgi:hypothetical protein